LIVKIPILPTPNFPPIDKIDIRNHKGQKGRPPKGQPFHTIEVLSKLGEIAGAGIMQAGMKYFSRKIENTKIQGTYILKKFKQ
jgi:hypothetical protein